MKTLIKALVILYVYTVGMLAFSIAQAQTVDEQLTAAGTIIAKQTQQINKLTASHRLLLASHNQLLGYLFIQACAQNGRMDILKPILGDWVKPFPLGEYQCPDDIETATFVVPKIVPAMP